MQRQRQLWADAERGRVEGVERLVEEGAKVDAPNDGVLQDPNSDFQNKGTTALHHAAYGGHEGVIAALLRLRCDVHVHDDFGMTALHVAAHYGHVGAARALLRAGCAPDSADASGRTAAHRGAAQGHAGVLRALHEGGADMVVADADGQTPAHAAAHACKFGVLLALVRLRVCLAPRDHEHKTVLDAAAEHVKLHRSDVLPLETVRLLFEYGVAITSDVAASMLSSRDEGDLSSNLRAMRLALQHAVLYAKNPVWAALVVSAAFQQRSLSAQTIKVDLLLIAKQFSRIATQLMRSEALDDERFAIELLTAPEKQHRIGTAFEVGPLEVALRSHDGDFIAQPVGLLQRTPTHDCPRARHPCALAVARVARCRAAFGHAQRSRAPSTSLKIPQC